MITKSIFSDPIESTQTINAQVFPTSGKSYDSIKFDNILAKKFPNITTNKIKFKNCLALHVSLGSGNIKNIKLFSNGKLQMPGIKHTREIQQTFDILQNELSECEVGTFPKKIRCSIINVSMKMIHIKIINPPVIRLDQEKIFDYITNLNDSSINVSFENTKTKQLNMTKKWKKESKKTIYYIFSTGCINMTLNYVENSYIEKSYDFIVNLFSQNINKFILKDRTYHIIKTLRIPMIKQKTKKWHKARLTSITSSDIKYVIDKKYKQYRSEFLLRKIMSIRFNITKFQRNPATNHGVTYEPIAASIYVLNRKKKYSLIFKESGFYTRKYKKIILGASPDGIIVKLNKFIKKSKPKKYILGNGKKFIKHTDNVYFNKIKDISNTMKKLWKLNQSVLKVQNITFSTDELEFLRYREEFIDGYLIEIKCPYSSPVLFDTSKDLKELNPGYYSQVQCQMFVTKINFTVLFAVKFKTFYNYSEFRRNSSVKDKRGMYAKLFIDDDQFDVYYPKNPLLASLVKFKKEICINNKSKYIRIEYCFWKVEYYRTFEVLFDQNWIKANYKKLKKYYKKIFINTEKTYLELSPPE